MADFDYDYAEAHLPDRWTILGVRLLPFRTGHWHILRRIQSPLLTFEREPELSDLILGLWFCSRPFSEGVKSLHSELPFLWRRKVRALAKECKKDPSLLESRILMFRQYAGESKAGFTGAYTDVEAEKTYAPMILVLKRDLMGHYHYSESEFFELPLRQAMSDRDGILERDGVRSFSSDEEFKGGEPA